MRTTVEIEKISCDMCEGNYTGVPINQIKIEGVDYDICVNCYQHLIDALRMLTIHVGLDIHYKF